MDSTGKTKEKKQKDQRGACPECKKPAPPRDQSRCFPFCSERCQMVDLGKWLDGDYAIPGEPTFEDQ
jgi:endogenous inhibitor of DNA gyrase (YacG/DUF329 family)